MNAIEIRNLSKSFRGMYAVDHLNMTVPQGAIYGFIGENGRRLPGLAAWASETSTKAVSAPGGACLE